LEEKASDLFCLTALADERPPPPQMGVMAEAAIWLPRAPIVGSVIEFAAESKSHRPKPRHEKTRHEAIARVRTEAYQVVGAVYDEIERRSGRARAELSREVVGRRDIPTLVNQVCWLNRTVRSFAGTRTLAVIAADDAVTRLDIGRPIIAEATPASLRAMGVPAYRKKAQVSGKGVTVAVIDSEVALNHSALAGRVVHRRNYTREPWGQPAEHGTAIAGIIASADAGHLGVAPDAVVYSYKILPAGDDFSGALAIQQALEDGAHVANCSWGVGPAGSGTGREARAIDAAWSLGLVVVKSAGNNGPGPASMTSPADAAGVITVAATDLGGKNVQDYSSRGPVHGLAGPTLAAPGGEDAGAHLVCCLPGGGFGDAGVGTSYAAPQVSGLVALLLEAEPTLTSDAVRDRLVHDARPIAGGAAAVGAGLARLA
jgi:serine protease AprX